MYHRLPTGQNDKLADQMSILSNSPYCQSRLASIFVAYQDQYIINIIYYHTLITALLNSYKKNKQLKEDVVSHPPYLPRLQTSNLPAHYLLTPPPPLLYHRHSNRGRRNIAKSKCNNE